MGEASTIRRGIGLAIAGVLGAASIASAYTPGRPPTPLDCRSIAVADVRAECLAAIPEGAPTGIWRTTRTFDNGWLFRRDVLATPRGAQVQYYWETKAVAFGPEDFRKPGLYFVCVITPSGDLGMRLNYSHQKIRLAMPKVEGNSWRESKVRVELDGRSEVVDFPRWTVVWTMHLAGDTRETLRRWTGRKIARIFHDAAIEDHPHKDGFAVFDLTPLETIRPLLTEKCRW